MNPETDAPSSKRQRTDDSASRSGKEGELVNSTELWFDDGNVVLRAESTCFKVHRSVLASHSPVFKDMFDMPKPEGEEKKLLSACPVVQLYDSSEDIHCLLKFFYGKKWVLYVLLA
jgi:hypothetical protein